MPLPNCSLMLHSAFLDWALFWYWFFGQRGIMFKSEWNAVWRGGGGGQSRRGTPAQWTYCFLISAYGKTLFLAAPFKHRLWNIDVWIALRFPQPSSPEQREINNSWKSEATESFIPALQSPQKEAKTGSENRKGGSQATDRFPGRAVRQGRGRAQAEKIKLLRKGMTGNFTLWWGRLPCSILLGTFCGIAAFSASV